MNNEVFVAFWVGVCAGLVFGIVMSAFIVAISNHIDGEKNEK